MRNLMNRLVQFIENLLSKDTLIWMFTNYYFTAAFLTDQALKVAIYNIAEGHDEFEYTDDNTYVWDILKETNRAANSPN